MIKIYEELISKENEDEIIFHGFMEKRINRKDLELLGTYSVTSCGDDKNPLVLTRKAEDEKDG